ncbi:MAG: hypothetical protein DRO08_04425, partial [Thermoprotei archaeon]
EEKAREILEAPLDLSEAKAQAESVIRDAEEQAKRIEHEAKSEIQRIISKAEEKKREVIKLIVSYVTGTE